MLKALKSNDPYKYIDSMKIYSRKIDPLGNKIKTRKLKLGEPLIIYLKYKNDKSLLFFC